MNNTPDNIESLADNEVFVFGSNFAGRHGAGAAKLAHDKFGAEYGIGEGFTGQCYAFPTLNGDLSLRNAKELEESRDRLYWTAQLNSETIFLVTRVGCGLAGQPQMFMRSLFAGPHPKNIVLPEDWDTESYD